MLEQLWQDFSLVMMFFCHSKFTIHHQMISVLLIQSEVAGMLLQLMTESTVLISVLQQLHCLLSVFMSFNLAVLLPEICF